MMSVNTHGAALHLDGDLMVGTDAAFIAGLKMQSRPPSREEIQRLRELVLRVDWDQIACWASCQDRARLH
ncbi:hypothetical protein LDDCCGHA_2704 [Methylobacterium oxalidis]|nr:hypothetical protein LDDCCGHA_2704 [Methylobacterium oxalidis]